jgi:hypothetical protein
MFESEDVVIGLFIVIISYIIGFISGFAVRAIISRHRRHIALKAREVRLARTLPG